MRKLMPLRRIEGALDAMSDHALIAACAIGDMAALGTLFERHAERLYRFLGRYTQVPRHELDDLVQASFMAAFRAASRYRGEAAVCTWLFGIAGNVARHHMRSEGR